ncbi:tRNA lysidine(34) synthetase TilS [Pseudoalteromonas sp. S3785]|uniref:tRNA lysidine(34) synthetase TilS n=1 Tax=Pseudoalteromonas sp. S3785 TaxID=579545 RepID=UPI00110BCE16|nr:tRNA lysidine(34) synthetase TilS [Pseudoalteromonas sp. S3785]TMO76685.1 tRNA lysidine(34) synthetase TilS [Pseudoalteromonas sp. S3785]
MQASPIYQHVKQALEHFFKHQQYNFTVALSGGVDSVVLLHVMHLLKQEIPTLNVNAIYVNHGLSQYANDWQRFCQNVCTELNVPFNAAQVTINPQTRTSLEAQAREARYKALDGLSPVGSVILLGQHLNDQIETFLLRLKRGSGLKGLGAMQKLRKLPSGRICYRPLLNITRSDIEHFAAEFNITHITDDSNTDERFDRNFLRARVVPLLAKRFTGFEHCARRSIELLQQQQALLDEYTELDLKQSINAQQALSVSQITTYSDVRITNVVRAWLSLFTQVMPSQKQLLQIINQAINAQVDAQMQVDLSEGQIRRHQGFLYFVTPHMPLADEALTSNELLLNDGRVLIKQQGKGLRVPLPNEQVTVRFNCNSVRIKPVNKPGSNTLKHWFKDAKVAPWLRGRVPLIFYNDELVQVVGYFVSEKHKDDNGIFWECK